MVRAETQEFTAIINNQVEEKTVVNRRPRSLTTLKLEVVAERARKMKRIKEALGSGTYTVQSEAVAKVLMKSYSENDLK